jgi:hypothetical protein
VVLALGTIAVATAAGAVAGAQRPPRVTATSEVRVTVEASAPVQARVLATEATAGRSTVVLDAAGARLPGAPAASELASAVHTAVDGNVVRFTVTGADDARASALAQAVVDAYVAEAGARAGAAGDELGELERQLADAGRRLAAAQADFVDADRALRATLATTPLAERLTVPQGEVEVRRAEAQRLAAEVARLQEALAERLARGPDAPLPSAPLVEALGAPIVTDRRPTGAGWGAEVGLLSGIVLAGVALAPGARGRRPAAAGRASAPCSDAPDAGAVDSAAAVLARAGGAQADPAARGAALDASEPGGGQGDPAAQRAGTASACGPVVGGAGEARP